MTDMTPLPKVDPVLADLLERSVIELDHHHLVALLRARQQALLGEVVRPPLERCRDDHVDITAHRADRAIAVLDLKRVRQVDFKSNRFAVAPALMGFQLTHRLAISRQGDRDKSARAQ